MAKDKFYFENFYQSASIAKSAAEYLVECLQNYNADNLDDMLQCMHEFEHNADDKKHQMTEALAKAFVTPVDREDLDVISQQMDDVCDLIEEVLQKMYVYDVKEIESGAVEYAQKLVSACDVLCRIMQEFPNFKKSKKMRELIIECNDLEEECDKLYLASMRQITHNQMDALQKYSWYKIYDFFEACIDACEHVSDTIGSIIMKNI